MCDIRKILSVISVLMLLFIGVDSAAEDGKLTYKLIMKYPTNISFKYSYNEQSSVKRTIADEKSEFKRNSTTFFTLMNTELQNSSIQKLEIKTDSIVHKIANDSGEVAFTTKGFELEGLRNEDIEQYRLPVSREFSLIVSPYYEVADLKPSVALDLARIKLEKQKSKTAPADYYLWKNSLADERLYHITDIKKINLPLTRIELDTTWESPIEFQIAGVTFYDTVKVKVSDERGAYLFLESEFKADKFLKDPQIIYGFRDKPVIPTESDLNCIFKLTITPQGTIDDATMDVNGKIKFKTMDKEAIEIEDTIQSVLKWKLMGRYNW